MPLRWTLLTLAALACGRTPLDLPLPDGAPTSCTLPAIPTPTPHPRGDACDLAANTPGYPALAAISGQDLLFVSSRGQVSHAFHFDVSPSADAVLRSRGDYVGALVLGSSTAEMALLRTDGTVLATAHATGTLSPDYGVSGNAGGLFLFGVFGSVWALLPSGAVLGPMGGVAVPYLGPDPDAQGRALALPSPTNSSAAFEWLDPCDGATTPARLVNASAFDGGILALDAAGAPEVETAAGVSTVGPALGMGWVYGLTPSGVALVSQGSMSFVTVDLASAAQRSLTLDYGPLAPAGGAGYLSDVGTSSNPAGFGVDSRGRVTMFMTAASGTYLFATGDGAAWTPIGRPVGWDPAFPPAQTLEYAEAAGTFVIQGSLQGGGLGWQVVSGEVDVDVDAPPALSWDGACVAALEPSGDLTIVQATTGATFPVAGAVAAGTSLAPVWLGGDDALFVQY